MRSFKKMLTIYFILEKKTFTNSAKDKSEERHLMSVGIGKPESLIIKDGSITI